MLDDKGLLDAVTKDADTIRQRAYSRAPRKSGKLAKAIVAAAFQKQNWENPAAFVAIDRRKGSGGRHAHLQEFGTVHSSPRPFFRPAVRSFKKMAETEKYLKDSLMRIGLRRRRKSGLQFSGKKRYGGSTGGERRVSARRSSR